MASASSSTAQLAIPVHSHPLLADDLPSRGRRTRPASRQEQGDLPPSADGANDTIRTPNYFTHKGRPDAEAQVGSSNGHANWDGSVRGYGKANRGAHTTRDTSSSRRPLPAGWDRLPTFVVGSSKDRPSAGSMARTAELVAIDGLPTSAASRILSNPWHDYSDEAIQSAISAISVAESPASVSSHPYRTSWRVLSSAVHYLMKIRREMHASDRDIARRAMQSLFTDDDEGMLEVERGLSHMSFTDTLSGAINDGAVFPRLEEPSDFNNTTPIYPQIIIIPAPEPKLSSGCGPPESPTPPQDHADLCSASRTAIEMLSEDALLDIFDFYRLDAMEQSPWKWHHLAHVCRKWRHVISVSPRRLELRILCKSGAPIESILASWPTLPLVARYNASQKPELTPGNVMTTLPHPDRPNANTKSEFISGNIDTTLLYPDRYHSASRESEYIPESVMTSLACPNRYNASSKFIPGNVMTALLRPDRLCEIDLQVTSRMTGSIVKVIQKPCQTLESIRIRVQNLTGPSIVVHSAFLGGSAPHLRNIQLDGISFPFPEMRRVLLSARNLVELHLLNIPNDVYFSPADLITSLFTLVHLKQLKVDFHSPASSPPPSMRRSPLQRTTLPSLTLFDFHGASGYLNEFVAQIDLPALCKISIWLFNDIIFEIPQYCQFIPSLVALGLPAWVFVTHSVEHVYVSFREGEGREENCFLATSCRQLDWQLSFATQILRQFSPFLSSVRILVIQRDHELPSGEEDVDSTQWLELFQLFTHVTEVHVWDKQLVPGIMKALVAEDMAPGILPELTLLDLVGYREFPSVVKDVGKFIRLSGDRVRYTD